MVELEGYRSPWNLMRLASPWGSLLRTLHVADPLESLVLLQTQDQLQSGIDVGHELGRDSCCVAPEAPDVRPLLVTGPIRRGSE